MKKKLPNAGNILLEAVLLVINNVGSIIQNQKLLNVVGVMKCSQYNPIFSSTRKRSIYNLSQFVKIRMQGPVYMGRSFVGLNIIAGEAYKKGKNLTTMKL